MHPNVVVDSGKLLTNVSIDGPQHCLGCGAGLDSGLHGSETRLHLLHSASQATNCALELIAHIHHIVQTGDVAVRCGIHLHWAGHPASHGLIL